MTTFRLLAAATPLLIVSVAACAATAPPRAGLAFARGDSVWVANADGSRARPLAAGEQPALSADGTKLAFVTAEPGAPGLQLVIASLSGKRVRLSRELAGGGASDPAWSPDGATLLFARAQDAGAAIVRVGADGSDERVLAPASASAPWRAPCWASDGASFWCACGDSLVHLGADGAVLESYAIAALVPGSSLDPHSRIATLAGEDSLLVTVDMDEPVDREGWDGPARSIYFVQPAHGVARRLTTLGEIEWDPCWVRGESYLYVTLPANERVPRLLQASLRGGRRVRVALDAHTPAVAR